MDQPNYQEFDDSSLLIQPRVPVPAYGFSLSMAIYSPLFRTMRFFSKKFNSNPLLAMSDDELQIRYATQLRILGNGLEYANGNWQEAVSEQAKAPLHDSAKIKIATFNVQDAVQAMDFFLVPSYRYAYQVNVLLPSLQADIICFNEVTTKWLQVLLECEFVRKHYFLSHHVGQSRFGNLILSRFPMQRVYESSHVRAIHALFRFNEQRVLISSVHWIAYEEYHRVRKIQIEQTIRSIENELGNVPVVMLGDWNLHGTVIDEEHLIQPYIDVWKTLKPDDEGITWDSLNNPMSAKMYPLDSRRMRLDRITLSPDAARVLRPTSIEIFAKERIAPDSPYYSYLTCSDHYGLLGEFALE